MIYEKFNCFLSIHLYLFPPGKKQGDREAAALLYELEI